MNLEIIFKAANVLFMIFCMVFGYYRSIGEDKK